MIPVEYLWLALFICFGVIGAARGLSKELGTATILLLSLFALKAGWERIGSKIVEAVPGSAEEATIAAAYYIVSILFVAFISYEGIVLQFPMKKQGGIIKTVLGFTGGLFNGYLVIGTIWDAVNQAKYFDIRLPLGGTGQTVAIANTLTDLHNTIVQYLPITFMNEFVLLVLGLILLLAIVLK
jgi:uncharacterized membrane protein required for colicin V production